MEHGINESEWKLFRQLRPLALDRFCQRVLAEVSRLAAATETSSHERYLAVFQVLQRRDEELAGAYPGRSLWPDRDHPKPDVIRPPLGLEPQPEGRAARPAFVGPAPAPARPGHAATPIHQRRGLRG